MGMPAMHHQVHALGLQAQNLGGSLVIPSKLYL